MIFSFSNHPNIPMQAVVGRFAASISRFAGQYEDDARYSRQRPFVIRIL